MPNNFSTIPVAVARFYILSLVFVAAVVKNGVETKISCIVCDNYNLIDESQKSTDGCSESDTMDNMEQYKSPCEAEEYNSCMKTVFERYQQTPNAWGVYSKLVTIVARDCAKSVMGNGCVQKTGSNSRTLDCYCDTDYCNHSPSLFRNYFLMILFSVGIPWFLYLR